jgi:hypothetical protein
MEEYTGPGTFSRHIRRGRILSQLSGNELMERVREVLDSRAGNWPVVGALRASPEPDL